MSGQGQKRKLGEESISGRKGMKLKTLPIAEKLKILDRIEAGASMHMVCEEFGIKKTTFYDLKKSKDKLREYARGMENVGMGIKGKSSRKRMTFSRYDDLDKAMFKWYLQERSVSVGVRGIDIQSAAGAFLH